MEDVAEIPEACMSDQYDLTATKSLAMGFDFWGYAKEKVKVGKVNGDAATDFP